VLVVSELLVKVILLFVDLSSFLRSLSTGFSCHPHLVPAVIVNSFSGCHPELVFVRHPELVSGSYIDALEMLK